MKHLTLVVMLIASLLLASCAGPSALPDDGRSVSTTYMIAGTAFDSNHNPVVGVMGLWDITSGISVVPNYTQAISNGGDFSFTALPEGHDYYIAVWKSANLYQRWITDRSPYFYDLSGDARIHFVGIL